MTQKCLSMIMTSVNDLNKSIIPGCEYYDVVCAFSPVHTDSSDQVSGFETLCTDDDYCYNSCNSF